MRSVLVPLLLAILLVTLGCSVDMDRDRPGDSAVADGKTMPDIPRDDSVNPDGGAGDIEAKDAVPDHAGDLPDLGMVLVHRSFSTAGPGSASNLVLLEGGFEMGETVCSSSYCLTGGIVP